MIRRFTKYPSNYVRASFFAYDEIPIATDGEWEMWAPASYRRCRQLSDGTHWAFGSSNSRYYDHYSDKGQIYIFVNTATGEKYASHPATASWFYDADDIDLGKGALVEFLEEHPKFIKNEFNSSMI